MKQSETSCLVHNNVRSALGDRNEIGRDFSRKVELEKNGY